MEENNLNASIANIILAIVAGHDLSKMHAKSFSYSGLHGNYFVHGIIGFLHYQSGLLNNDFGRAYLISYKATRYLALPCLMADLYRSNDAMSYVHLFSGIIPFVMFLAGTEDIQLGNMVLALNIISLCHYSYKNDRQWGWYVAAASAFAYFISCQIQSFKILYPLGLSLVEYCSFRVFFVHFAPTT